MKYLHKYGTRSVEIRRARKELYFRLTLVLAAILFFAMMILMSRCTPRLTKESEAALEERSGKGKPLSNPQLIKARAEVEALVSAFREGKSDKPSELEDLRLLEQAIEKQRAVIRHRGSIIANKTDSDFLEELLAMYDEEMGGFLYAQSARLEETARTKLDLKNYKEAITLLTRALRIQENINKLHPRSSARNPARTHQLKNQLLSWETEPLAGRADSLKAEAFERVAEKKYEEAKILMGQALQQQQVLNQNYRSSRLASLSRLKMFEEALREVEMARDVDRVASLMKETREALQSGEQDKALASIEQAAILQRRLIATYPGLEQQQELLNEIERMKDSAASLATFERIRELRELTREALMKKEIEALPSLVADWLRETQAFARRFPNSEFLHQVDEKEVQFLHDRIEEIPAITDMVYSGLTEVPGYPGVYLYNSEVHQTLYTSVTGLNPSNSKDPGKPVDSVTWMEANAFCKQLEWIIIQRVALPGRKLYRTAVGDVDPAKIPSIAWTGQNTNRETQPIKSLSPNSLGFYDLLGNVSEWLAFEGEGTPGEVLAIGGAVRDSNARLARIPEEARQPTERNRFVGFRFVVEDPD